MRVLITGAAGLVASSLAAAYGDDDVIALRHADLDITDARAVHETVRRVRPSVVFNCAVIGVDECEADPQLAERVNVGGPAHLARAAESAGATIVHFSTNYVFDGRRTDGIPYTPKTSRARSTSTARPSSAASARCWQRRRAL